MSTPGSPPWMRVSPRRRASYVDPGLRLSDAERSAVADRLSPHYADGRLDQTAFDERLDRAMKAKTRSDLTALFADLPDTGGSKMPEHQPQGRRKPRVLFLILVIVIAAIIGNALVHSWVPWLLIALIVFLWLRHGPQRQRGPS
jgi:hypothetical protein